MKEVEEVFEHRQLILHREIHQGSTKALGCELRGDLLASRVTPERSHKLRQAISGVLNRRKVSGRTLEVVIGHATFVSLTNRGLLSVCNTVYKYIQSCFDPHILGPSVREELQAFRGLLIFLHAD